MFFIVDHSEPSNIVISYPPSYNKRGKPANVRGRGGVTTNIPKIPFIPTYNPFSVEDGESAVLVDWEYLLSRPNIVLREMIETHKYAKGYVVIMFLLIVIYEMMF